MTSCKHSDNQQEDNDQEIKPIIMVQILSNAFSFRVAEKRQLRTLQMISLFNVDN
jgi:hypothetical protein